MLRKLRLLAGLALLSTITAVWYYQQDGSFYSAQVTGDNSQCHILISVGEPCPNGWVIVTGWSDVDNNCGDPVGCTCYADASATCDCSNGQMGQCSAGGCMCMDMCGDGVVSGAEECDDGNFIDGDGCTSACHKECYICDSADLAGGACIPSTCGGMPHEHSSMEACEAACGGTPDDECPGDPNKTEPGECGCGTPDDDADNDGTPDCNDECPGSYWKTEPGECGCDERDVDLNENGVLDCEECADPNKNYCGEDDNGDKICCDDACDSASCKCGSDEVDYCGDDDDGEPICCANGCAPVLDEECVEACTLAFFEELGACASEETPEEEEQCRQTAEQNHQTCIETCETDKASCRSAGVGGPDDGPLGCSPFMDARCLCEMFKNDPGGCTYAICMGDVDVCFNNDMCTQDYCNMGSGQCEHEPWVVPIDGCQEPGDSGDNGDDDDDEMKCSNGSLCMQDRCVYVKHCTNQGEPMDLDFECSGIGLNSTCNESGSSASNSFSSSKDEYMCCGGSCIAIGSEFDGVCASPAYSQSACDEACGSDTHAVCVNDQCAEAAGPGADECSTNNDCTSSSTSSSEESSPSSSEQSSRSSSSSSSSSNSSSSSSQSSRSSSSQSSSSSSVQSSSSVSVTQSSEGLSSFSFSFSQSSVVNSSLLSSGVSSTQSVVAQASSTLSTSSDQSNDEIASSTDSSSQNVATTSQESSSFSITSPPNFSSQSSVSSVVIAVNSSTNSADSSVSSQEQSLAVSNADSSVRQQTSVSSQSLLMLSESSTSSTETIDLALTRCGNGFLDAREQCDDGNRDNGDRCSANCTIETELLTEPLRCGDGLLTPGESCDDFNTRNGDGCSDRCQLEISLVAAAAVCGNGTLDPGEECDDSNRRDNDGCSSTCLLEVGICGDGKVQSLLGEQCEQGQDLPPNVTCIRCRYVSQSCGDGTVDPGEECDDGNQNSTSPDAACRPDCSLGRCGDGIVDSTELCDDGNRLGGDGCDRFCRTEDTPTQIAADITTNQHASAPVNISFNPLQTQQINFPTQPTSQQLPFQLPLAQLQPLMQNQAPVGDTGPAAVAIIAAGAAAGWGYVRRRQK